MVARTNPIDVHVGSRVRLKRTVLGLSQEALGKKLGLTFQQVQNYERGVNRISAGRLFLLGQVLDVPVTFFYDGIDVGAGVTAPIDATTADADGTEIATDFRREDLELLRDYQRLPEGLRPKVRALVREMAGPVPGQKRRGRPPGTGKHQRATLFASMADSIAHRQPADLS